MTPPAAPARICHVVGDSRFGGGSKIIMKLAEAGLAAGHDVEVVATDPEFVSRLSERGLRHVPLDCIWRPIRPLHDLVGLVRLHRHFRSARYDLVHTHTSKAGFVGRLAARLAGVPAVVHTVHGFSFHEGTGAAKLRVFAALERAAARWCHRLVTVSGFHRDWALELGIGDEETLLAIPNGITEPAGLDPESRAAVRREFDVADGDTLLLSMGRLAEGKGLEHLIRAMSSLRRTGDAGLRLLLPGVGPASGALKTLVEELRLEDMVTLPGFRPDVGALLAASDMVVLPSFREGLSIALLEAMAAGKPIIASRIGSNREATGDGEAASMVPCGDPEALAESIRALRSQPDLARSLGETARARWEARYTEDRMVADYMDLYRSLL